MYDSQGTVFTHTFATSFMVLILVLILVMVVMVVVRFRAFHINSRVNCG